MISTNLRSIRARSACASLCVFTLLTPLIAGCGHSGGSDESSATTTTTTSAPNNPPMAQSAPANYGTVPAPAATKSGGMLGNLSTGQKVAILAGTAALIYMYNKHKNAKGAGAAGQYYQSKNGRIYYRDAQGNAVWVTPPAGGISVPTDQAAQYNQAAQTGNYDLGGAPAPASNP